MNQQNNRKIESYFASIIVDQIESPSEDFLSAIIPAGQLSPLDALMVYRGDYEARLTEALQNRYEGVTLIAGDELFHDLARLYLSEEKSNVKDLKDFGYTFSNWLQHSAPLHPEMNYLYQIATIDNMFHHLFHISAPAGQKTNTDNAEKIFLDIGSHIQHAVFSLPAFTLWQHRHQDILPDDFDWEQNEAIILIKNSNNQIDAFSYSNKSLGDFWQYLAGNHSLLESLKLTSEQEYFDQNSFIPEYSNLLAWLTRHQLLRSI